MAISGVNMLVRLKNRLLLFLCLSFKMKILVIVSWLLMGVMRLLLLLMPFQRLTRLMGKANIESPETLDELSQSRANKIGWSVYTMSRHTPWESKCLVQAMAAQTLLRWLRIPGTLYLGVKKGNGNSLEAHAWVRSGKHIIVGDYGNEPYKCIMYYSV